MIFVTLGTQLPFDRMLKIIDRWAQDHDGDVFCQTGPTDLVMQRCRQQESLTPVEFVEHMSECDVVVAHAGIGSILSAMQYSKPVIIFPRKASLGEHRNEHQLATANKFKDKPGIYVAYTEEQLVGYLNDHRSLVSGDSFSPHADDSLIECIKDFIHS